MLCDNCLHKNVCKHTEHFKEYEKQYIEMRKKCSLFDQPIECACYTKGDFCKDFKETEDNFKVFGKVSTLKEITDNANKIDKELRFTAVEDELDQLKTKLINLFGNFEEILKLYGVAIVDSQSVEDDINEKFENILKNINELKNS